MTARCSLVCVAAILSTVWFSGCRKETKSTVSTAPDGAQSSSDNPALSEKGALTAGALSTALKTEVWGDYRITGLWSYRNLDVFLIRGQEKIANVSFLTLSEAMETGKVKVYETGDVNELSVENLSESEMVFIQAGEVVKGGKQDRVLGVDMVLAPKSGKKPIDSF